MALEELQSTTQHHDQRWEQLLDLLSHDASIVDQTVTDLRADVAGYDNVPTHSLQASARRNVAMAIRTIRLGTAPSPAHMGEADALAAERHDQDVSIGSVLAGFRVSLSIIFHRILELAPQAKVPVEQVLEISTLMWELGDAFSIRAAAVYQDREVSRAVADSARRTEWIRNVVTGSMPAAERIRGATLYDVPSAEPARALVVEVPPGAEAKRQQQLDSWAESAGVRLLTAVQGNTIVGLLVGPAAPEGGPSGFTVGLGQATSLEGLGRSFESASLALQAATKLGRSGVVDLERLSWRVGVHASPEITQMLWDMHMAPLEGTGEFGDHILEAVSAYLNHRMSIPLAARSIPVHVNTLRYRLRRFSQLTGADLGDLDTLIEISWALAGKPSLGTGYRHASSSDTKSRRFH